MRLAGKVALVTGAQQGIGRAIALALAGEGADVGLNFLDDPAAASLVAGEIRALGRKALTVKGDVAQARDVQALVDAVVGGLGTPDILVNNAGVFPRSEFLELSEREWDHVLGVNLKGGFLCAQAAARAMVAGQRAGAIVNISSLGGQLSFAGFSAYSATKFALEGASEALAQEVAPFGIKVLIVEPGQFRTQLAGSGMRHMPELAAYAATVGGTRAFAHDMHQTQAGDPRKAAAAIERALAAPVTPLRLQLGGDSVDAVRAHAQALLADLGAWEAVARGTDFDAR